MRMKYKADELNYIKFKPNARSADIVTQSTKDREVLVYDLKTSKGFFLNRMSTSIWQLCNGELDIAGISRMLSSSMNEKVSEEIVLLAVEQFRKTDLLMPFEETGFKNFNRRQALKKIGLTTTVMLPVVSALLVPTALHAASACTNPGGLADNTPVTATAPTLPEARTAIRNQCLNCRYRSSSNSSGCSDGNPATSCTINAICCSSPAGAATCV